MDFCISASSRTQIELIALGETDRYINKSSSSMDFDNSGTVPRYVLSLSKVDWHSSVHSKFLIYFRILKNEKHFSVDLDINLLSDATRPVSHCTSFMELEGFISSKALIFLGLTSIPLWVMRKSRNFSAVILKAHLLRLSFIWCLQGSSKASSRLVICRSVSTLLTKMSST